MKVIYCAIRIDDVTGEIYTNEEMHEKINEIMDHVKLHPNAANMSAPDMGIDFDTYDEDESDGVSMANHPYILQLKKEIEELQGKNYNLRVALNANRRV